MSRNPCESCELFGQGDGCGTSPLGYESVNPKVGVMIMNCINYICDDGLNSGTAWLNWAREHGKQLVGLGGELGWISKVGGKTFGVSETGLIYVKGNDGGWHRNGQMVG